MMKLFPLKKCRLLLAISCLAVICICTSASNPPDKPLDIYWIDVEGGAATLIVTPAGESILIDTGNPGGRDSERIYTVATQVAGLKQIDHLIITHFHIDHYGGAAELAQKMPVMQLYDKGIPESLSEDAKFAERIQPYRTIKAKRTRIRTNDQLRLKSVKGTMPVNLRCLGVDQQFISSEKASTMDACSQATEKATDKSDNANSTVFVLDFGSFRFFDGGDLTWNVEKKLVCPLNLPGEVDVFQVNHHGLDQSNNPVLIRALSPTVAVFNNGTQKGCGPETFTTLKNTPSVQAIYQMHRNLREDSHINTQEDRIANLEADCKANFIKLSVEGKGQNYTMQIPANGHRQSFKSKKQVN